MGQFGIGQAVTRFEDRRLLQGGGRYLDDVNLPGQAYAVIVRSMHAHARIRGIDTRAALKAPGVVAVLTGADVAQGRPRHHADDAQAQAPRRRADVRAAPPGAGPGSGPLRGRSRGRGRGRDAGPGRGCRRAGRDRLRAAALGDLHGRGRRRRPRVRRVPRQHLQRVRGRRPGGHRRRHRRRPPRGPPPLRHHARARPVHGGARRAGVLGSERGALHALRRRAVPAPRAQRAGDQHLQGPRAPDPRRRRRRRRRLRHQGLAVPRAPPRAVGGAQARAAGEVDVRPARGDPGRRARARQRHRGRAGPRRRGPVPRPARPHARQRGRLRLVRSQPAGDVQQRGHAGRRLHLPRRPRRGAERADQHQLDGALSRRRPAGGDVRHRAADRRRRPRARPRSIRAAPPQPDPGLRDAVQESARRDVRLRQFPQEPGGCPAAGRRGRLSGPARGVEGPGAAARPRHRQRHRARGRGAAGVRGDPLRPERHRHGPDGQQEPGPGPRDDLQADPQRAARPRPEGSPLRRRRHRPGGVRHGHHGLALDRDRRHRPVDGRRQGHRQGQEDRRPHARGLRGGHRVRRRALRGGRDRPRGHAEGGGARRLPAAPAPAWRGAGILRDRHVRAQAGHVAERHPPVRGGDRSRNRRRHPRPLRARRRRRHRHQSRSR